jgi:hypothetical protein
MSGKLQDAQAEFKDLREKMSENEAALTAARAALAAKEQGVGEAVLRGEDVEALRADIAAAEFLVKAREAARESLGAKCAKAEAAVAEAQKAEAEARMLVIGDEMRQALQRQFDHLVGLQEGGKRLQELQIEAQGLASTYHVSVDSLPPLWTGNQLDWGNQADLKIGQCIAHDPEGARTMLEAARAKNKK